MTNLPANWPLVDPNDDGIRPAGPPDACFYCRQKVGEPHGRECVIVQRRVKLRYVIEVEVMMPHAWDDHDIEFHRNMGRWCANNCLDDIEAHIATLEARRKCLCRDDAFHAEFVSVIDDTPVRELKTEEAQKMDAGMRALKNRAIES